MHLATVELRELFESAAAVLIVSAQHRQRHKNLVGMQARIVTAEIVEFGVLYRLYHFLRYELHRVFYTGKMLHRIQNQGCARPQQCACLGCDNGSVGKFDGRTRHLAALGALARGRHTPAIRHIYLCLLEQKSNLVDLGIGTLAYCQTVEGGEIAAYNLVLGRIAAHIVVADAESDHIHPHICRRFIWIIAIYAFEQSVEHRENLYIAVVIDGSLAVGFKVEGVYHIHIVEVGRSSLIGDIDRVLQREAPYGEGLELGITGLDAAFMLVVELAQTYSHLAASGAGSGDNHQRTRSLDIVVVPEALVGGNKPHIGRIALDGVMIVSGNAHAFEARAIGVGAHLSVVVRDYDGTNQEPAFLEFLAQTEHVHVVGYPEVITNFVFLYIKRADYNDNLGAVAQLTEHSQLDIRFEPGQHAAGMMVVEELSSEFKIEFVAELSNALLYMFGLNLKIFIVVESVYHNGLQS